MIPNNTCIQYCMCNSLKCPKNADLYYNSIMKSNPGQSCSVIDCSWKTNGWCSTVIHFILLDTF